MDISSMLEVEVQEVPDSKENVTPVQKTKQTYACQAFTNEENDFYKLTYGSDIASVRFLRLHCTACDEHIGSAPSETHNMHEHPILRVLLCAKCREFYGDGTFEQGDDATDMFCRWCANGGVLYCCSFCSNTFCNKCIKRNFDSSTIKRIEDEESWKCFVCDPKDLYPIRSITRALITHIETVTRILENNKRMSPREVEEKMHLDETKCCSRKRKRRKRLSGSEDDEEEDVNYVPELDREDSPLLKKRRSRYSVVKDSCKNGYLDHEYNKRRTVGKAEMSEYDPADLMNQCEQTMVEGDQEILNAQNANGADTLSRNSHFILDATAPPPSEPFHQTSSFHQYLQQQQEQELLQQQQQPQPSQPQSEQQSSQQQLLQPQQQKLQQTQLLPKQQLPHLLPKLHLNNSMGINPVPLANLLKVAFTTSGKRIKVTHGGPKLVAVPVSAIPKGITPSKITFAKPTTHFIMPKNMTKSLPSQSPLQLQQMATISQPPPLVPQQQRPRKQKLTPSVIDLDSDDESVIVENVVTQKTLAGPTNLNITNESNVVKENAVIPESLDLANVAEDEPIILSSRGEPRMQSSSTVGTQATSRSTSRTNDTTSTITIDGLIPLKTQQRYQRFERMLTLQSQEIDGAVSELKTKILKLVQTSLTSRSQQLQQLQQDSDLQNAAFVCTKRFHRAVRKALVELSHINDRLVRDYVHWKKKTDKAAMMSSGVVQTQEVDDTRQKKKEKENIPDVKTKASDNVLLEMTCDRESASESEDDITELNEEQHVEATDVGADFSAILDHLSIFKRKPTAVKAVGNDSVLMHDKGCQAYDVQWRDYEKCIGYSLLNKSEYDPETKQTVLRPVVQPDENFGKYQEQYLYYLQHIEDYGIETDESKGSPDPNHIPLKDLIDSSSPFIMDMLERLSPVTLSNGCSSSKFSEEIQSELSLPGGSSTLDAALDAESNQSRNTPSLLVNENTNKDSSAESTKADESETKTSDDAEMASTSKAVEELVKMVTKLSEDLRHEQQRMEQASNQESIELENIIKSVTEMNNTNNGNAEEDRMDIEITNVRTDTANSDECTIID